MYSIGTTGQTVSVTCNAGYSGGGTATCGTNGRFNTLANCLETVCSAGMFYSDGVYSDGEGCQLCERGRSSNAGSKSCDLIASKMPDGCLGISYGSDMEVDRSCNPRKAVDDWIAGGTKKDIVGATYGLIRNWDMSKVTDINHLFNNKKTMNADLSSWNVSSVTTMQSST